MLNKPIYLILYSLKAWGIRENRIFRWEEEKKGKWKCN